MRNVIVDVVVKYHSENYKTMAVNTKVVTTKKHHSKMSIKNSKHATVPLNLRSHLHIYICYCIYIAIVANREEALKRSVEIIP